MKKLVVISSAYQRIANFLIPVPLVFAGAISTSNAFAPQSKCDVWLIHASSRKNSPSSNPQGVLEGDICVIIMQYEEAVPSDPLTRIATKKHSIGRHKYPRVFDLV